jgi:hypothetical protein
MRLRSFGPESWRAKGRSERSNRLQTLRFCPSDRSPSSYGCQLRTYNPFTRSLKRSFASCIALPNA